MKTIKELTNSTVSKIRCNPTSTILEKTQEIKPNTLPEWLTSLFLMFTIAYKNFWTDALFSEQMRQANNLLWLNSLKGFSPAVILKAGNQAVSVLKFPPTIAEFLELATAVQKEENYELKRKEQEKNSLLEKEPNKEIAKRHIKQIMESLGRKSKDN